MTKPESETLNPWLFMWTKPRTTIQQIIDSNPEHLVGVLAILAGFSRALDRASNRNLGDSMELPFIIMLALFTGMIVGTLTLAIGSILIRWTGKWLGGQASSKDIRAAMAWSYVPIIWALIFWGLEIIIFGKELFTSEAPLLESSPSMLYLYTSLASIETIISIWAFAIFILCLGQVQKFSTWKALVNAVLAGLVFIVPLVLIPLFFFILAD